jgi:uncharacterized protein YhjY with autotransporter beta-barrel domain
MDRVMSDGYGQRLGERMRAENAQAIIARGLRGARASPAGWRLRLQGRLLDPFPQVDWRFVA